jgi:hypothetical protein
MTRQRASIAAAIGMWPCVAILAAQSERVSLSVVPHAGQTVRHRMTQDVTMTITPDADSDIPIPAMNVDTVLAFTMSQAAGSVDGEGRLPVVVTYDDFLTEVKINGSPQKLPDTKNPLLGKQFTALYTPDGTLVDLTGPSGDDSTTGPLRQMLMQLTAQLPKAKLAVGETTTTPLKTPFPFPIPGTSGFELVGTSTLTLVSIEKDGANRIASCDSKLQATLANAAAPSSATQANPTGLAMDLNMVGGGKVQVDVDRGVMKLTETTTTVDGTVAVPGRSGKAGRLKLHGVTKVTITEAR